MAAPGNLLRFDLSVEDISRETEELIQKSKAVYDAVGSLTPENVSYDSVVKVSTVINICLFYILSSN